MGVGAADAVAAGVAAGWAEQPAAKSARRISAKTILLLTELLLIANDEG
jgi:hypothetical protein